MPPQSSDSPKGTAWPPSLSNKDHARALPTAASESALHRPTSKGVSWFVREPSKDRTQARVKCESMGTLQLPRAGLNGSYRPPVTGLRRRSRGANAWESPACAGTSPQMQSFTGLPSKRLSSAPLASDCSKKLCESDWSQAAQTSAILARGVDWISNLEARDKKMEGTLGLSSRFCTVSPQSGFSTMEQHRASIRSLSLNHQNALAPLHKGSGEDAEVQRLALLANNLNLPVEIMTQAFDLFTKYATPVESGASVVLKGCLTKAEFSRILREMTGRAKNDAVLTNILAEAFCYARKTYAEELNFTDFAQWFSKCSFLEEFVLDNDQIALRAMARKYNIHIAEAEHYKQRFAEFDTDSSGIIDADEFERLLCDISKTPANMGLPAARIRLFWQEADIDGSGGIDFEEFLVFCRKYYDTKGINLDPVDQFYRSFRKTPWQA